MVGLQVRAHDIVDAFRRHASGMHVLQERAVALVPEGNRRAVLVVADAGIDKNGVMRGAHHEAVHAKPHLEAGEIKEMRRQPVAMCHECCAVGVGKGRERVEALHRLHDL